MLRHWTKIVLMLGQRRRRWPNIKSTLGYFIMCVEKADNETDPRYCANVVLLLGHRLQRWPNIRTTIDAAFRVCWEGWQRPGPFREPWTRIVSLSQSDIKSMVTKCATRHTPPPPPPPTPRGANPTTPGAWECTLGSRIRHGVLGYHSFQVS